MLCWEFILIAFNLFQVLCLGEQKGCIDLMPLLEKADPSQAPEPVAFSEQELRDETAVIFWTSGTTGMPKGTCQSHWAVANTTGIGIDQLKNICT